MSNTKVHIQDYRGFGIYFDTEKSTFHCDHADYSDLKTKQSFEAIKKYIDDFLKDNAEFKPFVVFNESVLAFERVMPNKRFLSVVGLRKDKRYVTEDKGQISEYSEKDYFLYRESFQERIDQIKQINEEFSAIRKEYSDRVKAIADSIKAETITLDKKEKF